MTYKLTDNTISQIAKLLQVAILTGTDVVDNLRTIRLVPNENGDLDPTPEFLALFETQLDKMVAAIAVQHTQDDGEVN